MQISGPHTQITKLKFSTCLMSKNIHVIWFGMYSLGCVLSPSPAEPEAVWNFTEVKNWFKSVKIRRWGFARPNGRIVLIITESFIHFPYRQTWSDDDEEVFVATTLFLKGSLFEKVWCLSGTQVCQLLPLFYTLQYGGCRRAQPPGNISLHF